MLEGYKSQRLGILDAVTKWLDESFGPSSPKNKVLRGVERRPWQPGNAIRPFGTVYDNGKKATFQKVSGQDVGDFKPNDGAEDHTLGVTITLDLAAEWKSQKEFADWVKVADAIADGLSNRIFPGMGIKRIRYVADEPITVVLGEAVQEDVWTFDFEVDYFVATPREV